MKLTTALTQPLLSPSSYHFGEILSAHISSAALINRASLLFQTVPCQCHQIRLCSSNEEQTVSENKVEAKRADGDGNEKTGEQQPRLIKLRRRRPYQTVQISSQHIDFPRSDSTTSCSPTSDDQVFKTEESDAMERELILTGANAELFLNLNARLKKEIPFEKSIPLGKVMHLMSSAEHNAVGTTHSGKRGGLREFLLRNYSSDFSIVSVSGVWSIRTRIPGETEHFTKADIRWLQTRIAEGLVSLEALRRVLTPLLRQKVVNHYGNSLSRAIEAYPLDFRCAGDALGLPLPVQQDIKAENRAKLKGLAPFFIPLNMVTLRHGDQVTNSELLRKFLAMPKYVEVFPPINTSGSLSGQNPTSDEAKAKEKSNTTESVSSSRVSTPRAPDQIFVRAKHLARHFIDPADALALEVYKAHDYDLFRLARYLSTNFETPISSLVNGQAARALQVSVRQVIASFPEYFSYDQHRDTVKFIVQECFKPDPKNELTEEELEEDIRVKQQRCWAKQERNIFYQRESQLLRLARAALDIRRNPAGTIFMDSDVFAYFIYDMLPENTYVDSRKFAAILPRAVLRNWNNRLSLAFCEQYPHLFHAWETQNPLWCLQRADLPRRFAQVDCSNWTSADIVDEWYRIAKLRRYQKNRPLLYGRLAESLPKQLRTRIDQLTIERIAEEQADHIEIGNRSQGMFISFIGERADRELRTGTCS